jgi:hypothetical protein
MAEDKDTELKEAAERVFDLVRPETKRLPYTYSEEVFMECWNPSRQKFVREKYE